MAPEQGGSETELRDAAPRASQPGLRLGELRGLVLVRRLRGGLPLSVHSLGPSKAAWAKAPGVCMLSCRMFSSGHLPRWESAGLWRRVQGSL